MEVAGFSTRKNRDWFDKNDAEIQNLLERKNDLAMIDSLPAMTIEQLRWSTEQLAAGNCLSLQKQRCEI